MVGVQPPRSNMRKADAAIAAEHGQVSPHAEILAVAAADVGDDGAERKASKELAHLGPHSEPARGRSMRARGRCCMSHIVLLLARSYQHAMHTLATSVLPLDQQMEPERNCASMSQC